MIFAPLIHRDRLILIGLCCLCFIKVLAGAGLADDAFILFRIVDNFVHGYGPRWNVDERSLAFSQPLWLMLHIPFAVIFSLPLASFLLSMACGIGAIVLLWRADASPVIDKALLLILPFALSGIFCESVISGLEYPLVFLLTAWFIGELFQPDVRIDRLWCAVVLCALTRLDHVLLLLPALLWCMWRQRPAMQWKKIALIASPALIWAAFSILYYGFVFSNAHYALLNGGPVPRMPLARLIAYDFFAFIFIAGAVAGGVYTLYLRYAKSHDQKDRAEITQCLLLIGGIALYAYYLFFVTKAAPGPHAFADAFLISVFVVCRLYRRYVPQSHFFIVFTLINLFIIATGMHVAFTPHVRGHHEQSLRHTAAWWEQKISHAPATPPNMDVGKIIVSASPGVIGYYAGPGVTIIDTHGVADPLLARLPVVMKYVRPRIFERVLPGGYLEARSTGDMSHMSDFLAQYYTQLRLLTSADLFDRNRLLAILGFQLWWYDEWRDSYVAYDMAIK